MAKTICPSGEAIRGRLGISGGLQVFRIFGNSGQRSGAGKLDLLRPIGGSLFLCDELGARPGKRLGFGIGCSRSSGVS